MRRCAASAIRAHSLLKLEPRCLHSAQPFLPTRTHESYALEHTPPPGLKTLQKSSVLFVSIQVCGPCQPGFVATAVGSEKCLPCDPGTVAKGSGNAACTKCGQGLYQSAAGQRFAPSLYISPPCLIFYLLRLAQSWMSSFGEWRNVTDIYTG